MKALLIHGLSSNSATWWRIRAALEADGWAVTAPDLRGHGTSAPAASYRLADYAADLPTGPWDLIIGHSLGGAIAVLLGATAARVILLDPVLEVSAADVDEITADQLAERDLTPESIRASKPLWSERDLEIKIAALQQVDPRAVEKTFSDNPAWNVLDAARALMVPTLILGGDHAVYSMLATETALDLVTANPRVEYRVIDGAGHSPHRDRPEETIAAIRGWLPAPVH